MLRGRIKGLSMENQFKNYAIHTVIEYPERGPQHQLSQKAVVRRNDLAQGLER